MHKLISCTTFLVLISFLCTQVSCNNRTKRNFGFIGGGLGPIGGVGGGVGGVGGLGTGVGVGGAISPLFPTFQGYGGYYNPNRITDCPTSEYNRTGICVYSPYECRSRGGRVVGQCYATPITGSGNVGSGNLNDFGSDSYYQRRVPIGVCCVYQVTCGGTILQNGTFFGNPNAPATYNDARACSASIPRLPHNVCQVRLDFVAFNIKPPTAGTCDVDKFIIDGQSQNNVAPAICGYNAGQHMYVEVDRGHNPITLTVLSGTGSQYNRQFDIRVTFIHCLSPYKAPPNCLQYHYNLNGEVKSFNFDYYNQNNAKYMRSLDYAICFRKLPGFCSITYSMPKFGGAIEGQDSINPAQRPQGQFVGKYFNIVNMVAAGIGNGGAGPVKCPNDYLMLNTLRFCGTVLNDDIERGSSPTTGIDITDSGTRPIIARFVTNDDDMVGYGFFLHYRHICKHCVHS